MLAKWLAQLALESPDDKPLVAVSACLLGRAVRYDGDHKHEPIVTETLAHHLTLHELCPEVGIGMPVPRPPIQVVMIEGQRRVRGVNAPENDVTEALQHFGYSIADHFCGFVLKARSPSCGVGTTPVADHRGELVGTTDGEFSHIVAQRFPCAPRTDESGLQSAQDIDNFLLRVHLYRHWRKQPSMALAYDWRAQLIPLGEQITRGTHHWLETLAAHSP